MRRSTRMHATALTLTCALSLAVSARVLRADDAAPVEAPEALAADGAAAEAPVVHQPVAEMFEEVKLIKVDIEGKTVTILISPDKEKSGRAYKRLKFMLDDNSLIMVDQQPSTFAALQEGMLVNISHIKKGKNDVVDTIVVLKGVE